MLMCPHEFDVIVENVVLTLGAHPRSNVQKGTYYYFCKTHSGFIIRRQLLYTEYK